MNRDKIISLMEETANDVEFAEKLSDELVAEKTADLDKIMREVQADVVNAVTKDEVTVSFYLAALTNAVYFLGNKIENFGFYDDITKANAKLKYNEMYAKNQLEQASQGKKTTQADNTLYAEMNSIDETMLNVIYSRSVKRAKLKLDAANEMIRTLSKLLSVLHDQLQATRFASRAE